MNAQVERDVRPSPQLMPLGDCGMLVKFSDKLDDASNAAAIEFAHRLQHDTLPGVVEIVTSLVSVFLRYDPFQVRFSELAGAVRLVLNEPEELSTNEARTMFIDVSFGGESGPDLGQVAALCGMDERGFVEAHNKTELRVLATGFAPGFVYCGLHPQNLHVPRRSILHAGVPAGSVLFAAGQTAITSTQVPTGWHVIGQTRFRNFDANASPPTSLQAGDNLRITKIAEWT